MDGPTPRTCRILAITLIVGSALLRLVFLAWDCPLDLAPDEAHYWDWALVFAYGAIFQRSAAGWWLAGILVGLGVLFKYTMVVWLPSLALFLLFSPQHRRLLWSPSCWILFGLASLSAVPILVWNFH